MNTTDSAVRITHLPSGIVVSSQNEKSQLQNRESALRVLRSRLLAAAREEAAAAASDQRRSQVRTVDRSERVRTYNFPENRISDHRVGFKAYNLDAVLDGELDAVLDALRRRTPPSCWRPAPDRAATASLRPRRRAGSPTPASTPRGWTPSCCSPRCSACPVRGCSPWTTCRRRPPRASTPWSSSGPTGCRCSTSPAGAVPLPRTRRRARASSCRARRPSSWPAGRSSSWPASPSPIVVDLGAGSGAIALSLAHEHPGARVTAVERDPGAIEWTRHNAAARAAAGDRPVDVLAAT